MRALVLNRTLRFDPAYRDPGQRRGESLVRVRMAGICGTDLELTRGYMAFEGVPGHEFVGEVAETGRTELAGKRIVGEINAACGDCEWCRAGMGRHCANRTVLGILGRDGAFADYLCLPDENLLLVPESLPDEAAVFTEPLAAAYEIFEQTHLDKHERIVILGDGRLGAVVAIALKAEGYAPMVAGHHRDKLARLDALGFATSVERDLRSGFDVVIDCTGSSAGFGRALELVRPRGKLILKSTVAGSAPLSLAPLVVNEVAVIGSRCGRFRPALDALAADKVDPRPLISAVYPLEEGLAAFARAAEPSAFKVLLRMS